MSKVVTIPNYTRPNWICSINGHRYCYPAGSTQEVPDEVAQLIEDQQEQWPVPAPVPGNSIKWDDIEGKPFSKAVLIKKQKPGSFGELTSNYTPSVGEVVQVILDGVSYSREVVQGYECVFIGNGSICYQDGGTDDHFCITWNSWGTSITIKGGGTYPETEVIGSKEMINEDCQHYTQIPTSLTLDELILQGTDGVKYKVTVSNYGLSATPYYYG